MHACKQGAQTTKCNTDANGNMTVMYMNQFDVVNYDYLIYIIYYIIYCKAGKDDHSDRPEHGVGISFITYNNKFYLQ